MYRVRGQLPPGAKLDRQDAHLIEGRCWGVSYNGYVIAKSKGVTTYLHRKILQAPKGKWVDHVNGDKLDNRRSNLRFASAAENAANTQKLRRGKTSKYRGVYWVKANKKWAARAHFRLKGILQAVWLGLFVSELHAATVYDDWMQGRFGEFYVRQT